MMKWGIHEISSKVKCLADIQGQGTNWQEIVHDMADSGNGNNIKSVVKRLLLAASVYNIWKERNGRIFRDVTKSGNEVFNSIVETVKTRLVGLTVRDSGAVRRTERVWGITCKRAV
ncbi:reverse transcriptase domain, Reverse transcriptase zinc-binding domain protein [Artemisia annua]|uniref:Reverse transcriptase domain, Reverse transcriptase zinc-binding domain protein n=1 Tax=Artemisia annua TaxID=35608 RepID=A0A2U1KT59_ARTAN|nr:reverse transcriptase domain, Reverse transcriptase zinc-binding domain protein [Artemisia annua]